MARQRYKSKASSRTVRREKRTLFIWGMKHTRGGYKRGSKFPY